MPVSISYQTVATECRALSIERRAAVVRPMNLGQGYTTSFPPSIKLWFQFRQIVLFLRKIGGECLAKAKTLTRLSLDSILAPGPTILDERLSNDAGAPP